MAQVQKLVDGAHFVGTAQAHVARLEQLSRRSVLGLLLQGLHSDSDAHGLEELALGHRSVAEDLLAVYLSYLRDLLEIDVGSEI